MALLPYEKELVDYWLTIKPSSIRVLPRTGVWIRAHLNYYGEDYCYHTWKEHQRFVSESGINGLKQSPYEHFRIYWGVLSGKGMIAVVRTEPSLIWNPRVFYTLVPDIPIQEWNNPLP